jgi:hypothetical protein
MPSTAADCTRANMVKKAPRYDGDRSQIAEGLLWRMEARGVKKGDAPKDVASTTSHHPQACREPAARVGGTHEITQDGIGIFHQPPHPLKFRSKLRRARAPRVEERLEFSQRLGRFFRQVGRLAHITGEIIEMPCLVLLIEDKLVIAPP